MSERMEGRKTIRVVCRNAAGSSSRLQKRRVSPRSTSCTWERTYPRNYASPRESERRTACTRMCSFLRSARMIEVASLSKLYGDFAAVSDLSFAVQPGEIMGLVGPNGAGKLRCLAGIIPPTSSAILMMDSRSIIVAQSASLTYVGVEDNPLCSFCVGFLEIRGTKHRRSDRFRATRGSP